MIKIIHAYPNLMNILGAGADIIVLKRFLEDAGQEVVVQSFEIGDEPDFTDVDLFYCGAGTEDRMLLACKDVLRYADCFKSYADNGGFALLMGTGMAIAGNDGAGCVDVSVTVQDFRHYSDVIGVNAFTGDRIVGAYNSSCSRVINERPFCRIEYDSNMHLGGTDGFIKNNIIGSEITAPLLARNPIFLKHFAEKLTGTTLPDNNELWYKEALLGYYNAIGMLENKE